MFQGNTSDKLPTDWRARLGSKLVSADEAISHIRSGDRIVISIAQSTPLTLCTALAARLMELENVVVNHGACIFNWDLPGLGERFRLESFYLTLIDRPLYARGAAEFTPVSYFVAGKLPPALDNFNVCLVKVSSPDAAGNVNFGDIQIMSKLLARNANLVIAEVDEKMVRIGGDNSMHVSEIDFFVEQQIPLPTDLPIPPPSEEERRTFSTICEIVAHEMVPDRATIQVGVGATSGRLMPHLRNHHDLGMQTEIIPWGTAPLVRDGVITGKHKKLFPGLVVGSAFAVLTPREELEFADGHPAFALYDFNLTDDIRLIAREEGLIAINNAISVDLTGQVDAESIAHQMYTGTGGQTAFAVGTCLSAGTTITVTPSTSIVNGKRVSRIVPTLAPGSIVTVPRAFVHYVVTEYGIATLRGKSIKERARELIAIAHPDFRADLKVEAKRLYG
jgi:4-hydroxybutyrate CoA-transferase